MVLITGCNGLIGRTLAKRLMEKNIPVRGFDFWKTKESPETTEFIEGSILDYELLLGACEGVDVVYHLMEIENPSHSGRRFMKRVNVNGTEYVLNAAIENGVKRVIFLSSADVYGSPDKTPITEELDPKPNTPFGKDKLKAEKLCWRYAEKEGLAVTVFRPTAITGPGTDESMILVILYMALAMEDSNRLYIAGDGDSCYQLIHPDDVVSAFQLAIDAPASNGKTYNLGSDNVPTQNEEVTKLKELAGLDARVKHISAVFAKILSFVLRPLSINYLRKEHLVFILSNFVLDCGKAKEELGWRPQKDNIEIFLETIQWYKAEKL